MALFDIPTRGGKSADKLIINKAQIKKKQPVVNRSGLLGQIERIKNTVDKYLGKHKDDFMVIQDCALLDEYISACNKNNVVAIDTETTGLDPLQDKIVGLCLYTPNMKPCYVPINHISYITNERIPNQLNEQLVGSCLQKLTSEHIIMFNANFDVRVVRNQLGVRLVCDWDCYLASRLLNENEPHKGLKALHQKYVLQDAEEEFNFEALFKGVSAEKIPINVFYLYAAKDAIVTYELYEYQKKYLYYDRTVTAEARNGMNGVSWVFHNIEMPCVEIVADMEDTGIELDLQYAEQLSVKYHKALEEKANKFYELLDKYADDIDKFIRTHGNVKLDNPINIASSSQISVLLYDILKIAPVDTKNPRGTGEAILVKIDNPITNAILEYREVAKLLSTYIDKLPECVNSKDGRIHCKFNQYGADTGRFSSQDPKLNWAYI